MRTASNVFRIDRSDRKLRSAKAVLRTDTLADVREIIRLAPELGRENPRGARTIKEAIRILIAPSDPGGREHDAPIAARATARRVRQRHLEANAVIESVSSQMALLDQVLTTRRRSQS